MSKIVDPELVRAVAVAVRRSKFERNSKALYLDDANISEYELAEARAAVEKVYEWLDSYGKIG